MFAYSCVFMYETKGGAFWIGVYGDFIGLVLSQLVLRNLMLGIGVCRLDLFSLFSRHH